ncbi:hypothetical protein GF314_02440 [bacterium]|nr:hypothetical protein [bacterium]
MRRRIRWPAMVAILVFASIIAVVLANPSLLTPAVTHLVNRQLEASLGGSLRVGKYDVRPFGGIDAYDVTFTLPGDRGGLTLVAVDTLELDFRLREVIGLDVRLRRLAATGLEVYHNQDPPSESPGDGFSVPRFQVDVLSLRDGRAEVSNHHGQLLERISSFDWHGSVVADGEQLRIETRSGSLDWPTRSSTFDRVYGTTTVQEGMVTVDGLAAAWNDGEVEVSGYATADSVDVTASGRSVDAQRFVELTGIELEFDAAGDVDIRVEVTPDATFIDTDFTGRFEGWQLDAVHGEAVIADGRAVFRPLRGGVGGAWFDGELTVTEEGVVTVAGEARDVDLRQGLIPETSPADLPRTAGHGRLEIVHTTEDEVTRVRGVLADGEIEIMPFDSCWVDVWARDDSLHFHAIDLRQGSIQARLTGSSDPRDIFAGDLAVAIDDLRDLPDGWEWPPVTGRAAGRVTVGGPLDDLRVEGLVTYGDLTLGPMLARRGEARITGERVLSENWRLDADTAGPGFVLGGVPLGDYVLRIAADPTTVEVDSFRAERGDTVVTVHGRADFVPDRADLTIDRGAITLAGNHWQLDGLVGAAVGPGLLHVPALHLRSDQGELVGRVRYQEADSLLSGQLDVRNFDLNLLDPFLDRRFRPGGRATAQVVVQGTPDSPHVMVHGAVTGAAFDLARVDSLALTARYNDEVVTVDTLSMATDHGRVGLRGTLSAPWNDFWPNAALDVDLDVHQGDLRFLDPFELEALDRLTGRLDGQFHVGGTTRDPLIRGDFSTAPFTYQWLRLDRLEGAIRVDPNQLALGDLVGNQDELRLSGRVEVPLVFDLLSEPVSPPEGPFLAHLVVEAGSDLGPLLDATSAFTRVEGRGGGELIVSGPLSHPGYQGSMEISDVGFVLRGNEEIFRDCSARGEFQGDRLELRSITGREGLRGTFTGQGYVLFDGLELKTWDIDFEADRFLVASIPDLRAVVRTRNGGFEGVPVGPDSTLVPLFTGDYEVIKGRYTGNFSDQGAGTIDPTLGTVAPDWLADVRITGPPRSARIINNTMELDLSGDVTLVRDADGMVLNGGMTIDNGRLPVFHNTFRVVRGRLDFSRDVGVVPVVDIDAETRVRVRSQVAGQSRVERITVTASGPANAMSISYSSESGYPREAIERMLLGLSPYPDAGGDQSAITNASIGAGFNILEREIAREIDLFDTVEIDQIQREQTAGVGLEPLIGVGKYLGTDLYIKYAQGINQNDRDLLIEYQINDLLLLQTEIRRRIDEYQGDATYNVDLKYRHEY